MRATRPPASGRSITLFLLPTLILAAAMLLSASGAVAAAAAMPSVQAAAAAPGPPQAWTTPAFFVGASHSRLEYGCLSDGHFARADFALMRERWGMNTVRIPLSAPMWLDAHGACPSYRATVEAAVANALAEHLYVILTLAWINPFDRLCAPGNNPAGAGYPMADAREAIPFWRSVATTFTQLGYWHIGYDLYSEPHDVSWSVWKNGGSVTVPSGQYDRCPGTYQAVGYQQLVSLVNGIAGWHRVFVAGDEWGGDLSGVIDKGMWIAGHSVTYAVHLYPGPHSSNPANWPDRFGNLAARAPVVALEFGGGYCGDPFLAQAMAYLATHTRGMLAWAWNKGDCTHKALLASWDGTPSAYGQPIQRAFVALSGSAPGSSVRGG